MKSVKIPVLSNGNVQRVSDVVDNLRRTETAGIMSAEALLAYPALFAHLRRWYGVMCWVWILRCTCTAGGTSSREGGMLSCYTCGW